MAGRFTGVDVAYIWQPPLSLAELIDGAVFSSRPNERFDKGRRISPDSDLLKLLGGTLVQMN